MATSYDYGLTAADITAEIPGVDASSIGASTEPVDTGDVAQWINDAASKINATLDKSGITASASMDADAHDTLAAAVKMYAVWKTLQVMGRTGPILDHAYEVWTRTYAEYSNRPQGLGDAYDDGLTVNIDSDDTGDAWSFVDNEGSLW